MPKDTRLLDLDEIFAKKFGAKKPSKFVIAILKRILHQEDLNDCILHTSEDGAVFCEQVLEYLNVDLEVEGLENIPKDGSRYTFASNHPLGGVDGMAICSIIARNFGSPKMLVNDFLSFIPPLAPLCIPINKVGAQARNLPVLIDSAFSSEDQLLIFPAGVCSRKINGEITDLPWTKTFVSKSLAHKRTIVPIHFEGKNSKCFYNVATLCKKFNIKFNLAMLLLPKEMLRSRGKHFKVTFGKPIVVDDSRTTTQWVNDIRSISYGLASK